MSYKNKKILQSVIAIILAAAFVFKMDICLWKVDSRAEVNRELCFEDFENGELLVITDDPGIIRGPAVILSEYDGIYLLGFENKEIAIEEYSYYSEVALYVEPNSMILRGADEESTPGDAESYSDTLEEENDEVSSEKSFDEELIEENTSDEELLEESVSEEDQTEELITEEKMDEPIYSSDESDDTFGIIDEHQSDSVRGSIALIDTGASGSNVVSAVSVIGESTADDNGHGTALVETMASVNPDVRVFSIKALDSNCCGTVADVYAAIMLAVSSDVSVINLSMSSVRSADSEILEQAVNEALAKGIVVVAAAGNKSSDASLFTPANIPGVITVGACDENGNRIESSNYGDCVDCYEKADSTSVAAAIKSAHLFSNDESLGETPIPEGNSSPMLNYSLTAEDILVGSAEGTVPMWNGLSDSGVTNWLTAVSTGTGRYYYTLTDGGGISWNLYCIDPDKRCPVDSSVTMYAEPISASSIPSSWLRGVMAVLYYGKHAESTGKYSYNDWSASFSGSTSAADRTHWAAAYASGWDNSGSTYYSDAVSNYNKCLGWLNSADPNGDGIFYVGNGGSSEGESGSDAYRSFLSGTGYHVVIDMSPSTNVACYQGFKVVNSTNENIVHSSSSYSGGRANATITYSGGKQYTNWMKLVPYYTGTYSSKFAEQSVQFRVPSGTTVTVRNTSGATTDYTEGQLVTVWGWYEFRLSAPITKSGNIFSDGGTIRLDNRTLFIEGWLAEPGSSEYQRLAYAYTPDWNQYFSLGTWNPRGMVTVKKNSQNPYNQPSMDGITYGLYSDSSCTSRLGVYTLDSTGNVKAVSVDSNSIGAFYDPDNSTYISGLPFDTTFYVKEISKGSTAYKLNTHAYPVRLSSSSASSTVKVTVDVKETPDVFAEVQKSSANTFVSSNNPNYELSGTIFTVYKNQSCTDTVGTIRINSDGSSSVLKLTDKLDIDSTTGLGLETTFYYKETISGRGYVADSGVYSFKINPSTTKTITLQKTNTPYYMPINISVAKRDASANNVETTGSTLAGAEFTLRYYPQDITALFDKTKAAKASMVFATKKQSDGSYKIDTKRSFLKSGNTDYFDANGNLKLPLGYITITESAAPSGYTTNGFFTVKDMDGNLIQSDGGAFVLKVTAGGITTTTGKVVSPSTFVKEDEPIRADIELTKLSLETEDPMEGVQFLITNKETGQSVTICTDENGYYSSSSTYAKHSVDTNGGNARSGIWFGDASKIDDARSALHAGAYTVKEQRSDANGNKQLELVREIVVDSSVNGMTINVFDGTATSANGKNYNADKPVIHTLASVPDYEGEENATNNMEAEEDEEEAETENDEIPQEDADAINKTLFQVSNDAVEVNDQTIIDRVYYSGLRAGMTYTLKAELMVVDVTGEVAPFMEGDSQYVRYKTFNVEASYGKTIFEKSGEVEVILDGIDPRGFEGQRFVVYETLYLGGMEDIPADDSNARQYSEYSEDDDMNIFPVEHKDPSDENQTVRVPDIHTNASDNYTGDHVAFAEKEVTYIDVISYTGLTPGKRYTVTGQLMIKEIEEESENIDKNNIEGGNKEEESEERLENEPLLDSKGDPVTASLDFVPDSETGFVELEFTYDASILNGKTVVAFETLSYRSRKIAEHTDINDEDEALHYPDLHTTSANALSDDTSVSAKEVLASSEASIKDTIHFSNLISNRKYLARGTLVDRESGEALKDATGKEIKGETVFTATETDAVISTETPDAPDTSSADGMELDMSADHADYRIDGDIEVLFDTFDATELKNVKAVIYEELYLITECTTVDEDGNIASSCRLTQIGEHKDLGDVDQFITFAEIGTEAKDKTTGIKLVPYQDTTVIEDTVTYKNLNPNEEYTLTAYLHVKNDASGFYSDGAVLLDKNGEPVTTTVSFTPEEPDGELVVSIEVDTASISNLDIVVFEYLKNDLGIAVAMHEEISDDKQTVHVAGGRTTALNEEGLKKEIEPEKDQKIVDTCYYYNLIPGLTYTITGVLMDKSTGKAVTENGKEITVSKEFVPEEKDGTVELEFTLDAESLAEKTIVVYETVTYEDVVIFKHRDLEDADQSITVNPVPVISEKGKEEKATEESAEETGIYSKQEESETEDSKDATVSDENKTVIKTKDVINISVIIAIGVLSCTGTYIICLRKKKRM